MFSHKLKWLKWFLFVAASATYTYPLTPLALNLLSSQTPAKKKGAWGSNPDPLAYRDIIYYSYNQIVLRC